MAHVFYLALTTASLLPRLIDGCFFGSHHAIGDDHKGIVLEVDENTPFAIECTCPYDSSVMTPDVSWTINGKTFPEKDTGKVNLSQQVLKHQSLVRGQIDMVADRSDSGNLCCRLDKKFSCLNLLIRPKDDVRVKVDIDMSISYRSNGRPNWKIDVNCTVTTDNQQYRDYTLVVLTINNGEKLQPYYSIDAERNHKYWERRYYFSNVTGRGKENVTCLRLPAGQGNRLVSVHIVFDPNLSEEYYITSEPVSTTTTMISPQQKQQTSSSTLATDNDVTSHAVVAGVVVGILFLIGVVVIIGGMAYSSYCVLRSTSGENERNESVQVESSYSKNQLTAQEAAPSAWGGSVQSDPEMNLGNMLTTTGSSAYETDIENTPGSGKGDQPSGHDETSKSVREVPETSKDQSKDEVIRCCPCTQQIIKVVNRRMDECCDMAQDTRDEMLSSISGAFANRDATETAL